jgi:hypothetical protein
MAGIDWNRLRAAVDRDGETLGLPRHRPGEMFLKGPIPWAWLEVAGRLPGRALHVALTLWLRAGIERRAEVKLPLGRLRAMGVDRHAAARGVRALEDAGLITVRRSAGRAAAVTIQTAPEKAKP